MMTNAPTREARHTSITPPMGETARETRGANVTMNSAMRAFWAVLDRVFARVSGGGHGRAVRSVRAVVLLLSAMIWHGSAFAQWIPADGVVRVAADRTATFLVEEPTSRAPSLTAEDGTELATEVGWFVLDPPDVCAAGRWVDLASRMRSVRPSAPGAFAIVRVTLPEAADTVRFGRARFGVASIDLDNADRLRLAATLEVFDQNPVLMEYERVRADPFQRWRWVWARGGGLEGVDPGERAPMGALPMAFAEQRLAEWNRCVATLARLDADLAREFVLAAAGTVHVEDDVAVPMWSVFGQELERVRSALLDVTRSAAEKLLAVRRFVEREPGGFVWVIDDAGRIGEGDMLRPAIGAALLGESGVVRVRTPGGLALGDGLLALESRSVGSVRGTASPAAWRGTVRPAVRLDAVLPSPEASDDEELVTARREIPLLACGATRAAPPGLRFGPLLADWTMASLRTVQPVVGALPADGSTTVGLIGRSLIPVAELDDAVPAYLGDVREVWTLYLECSGASGAGDAVTVWIGPYEAPTAVWSIARSGELLRTEGVVPRAVRVARRGESWSVRVALHDPSLIPGDVLRLGITRTTACGGRAAWPRRMTPWQDEPGRGEILLDAWDGTGERVDAP